MSIAGTLNSIFSATGTALVLTGFCLVGWLVGLVFLSCTMAFFRILVPKLRIEPRLLSSESSES